MSPTIVGTTTMARTIQMELPKEVQKSSSVRSFCQLSSPMNSGSRTPRQRVKVRYTFQTSGMSTTTISSASPGSRYSQ
jgi:hypothetical protein